MRELKVEKLSLTGQPSFKSDQMSGLNQLRNVANPLHVKC